MILTVLICSKSKYTLALHNHCRFYMVLCNYVIQNLHAVQISRCIATFHCAFGATSRALLLRTYHCPCHHFFTFHYYFQPTLYCHVVLKFFDHEGWAVGVVERWGNLLSLWETSYLHLVTLHYIVVDLYVCCQLELQLEIIYR